MKVRGTKHAVTKMTTVARAQPAGSTESASAGRSMESSSPTVVHRIDGAKNEPSSASSTTATAPHSHTPPKKSMTEVRRNLLRNKRYESPSAKAANEEMIHEEKGKKQKDASSLNPKEANATTTSSTKANESHATVPTVVRPPAERYTRGVVASRSFSSRYSTTRTISTASPAKSSAELTPSTKAEAFGTNLNGQEDKPPMPPSPARAASYHTAYRKYTPTRKQTVSKPLESTTTKMVELQDEKKEDGGNNNDDDESSVASAKSNNSNKSSHSAPTGRRKQASMIKARYMAAKYAHTWNVPLPGSTEKQLPPNGQKMVDPSPPGGPPLSIITKPENMVLSPNARPTAAGQRNDAQDYAPERTMQDEPAKTPTKSSSASKASAFRDRRLAGSSSVFARNALKRTDDQKLPPEVADTKEPVALVPSSAHLHAAASSVWKPDHADSAKPTEPTNNKPLTPSSSASPKFGGWNAGHLSSIRRRQDNFGLVEPPKRTNVVAPVAVPPLVTSDADHLKAKTGTVASHGSPAAISANKNNALSENGSGEDAVNDDACAGKEQEVDGAEESNSPNSHSKVSVLSMRGSWESRSSQKSSKGSSSSHEDQQNRAVVLDSVPQKRFQFYNKEEVDTKAAQLWKQTHPVPLHARNNNNRDNGLQGHTEVPTTQAERIASLHPTDAANPNTATYLDRPSNAETDDDTAPVEQTELPLEKSAEASAVQVPFSRVASYWKKQGKDAQQQQQLESHSESTLASKTEQFKHDEQTDKIKEPPSPSYAKRLESARQKQMAKKAGLSLSVQSRAGISSSNFEPPNRKAPVRTSLMNRDPNLRQLGSPSAVFTPGGLADGIQSPENENPSNETEAPPAHATEISEKSQSDQHVDVNAEAAISKFTNLRAAFSPTKRKTGQAPAQHFEKISSSLPFNANSISSQATGSGKASHNHGQDKTDQRSHHLPAQDGVNQGTKESQSSPIHSLGYSELDCEQSDELGCHEMLKVSSSRSSASEQETASNTKAVNDDANSFTSNKSLEIQNQKGVFVPGRSSTAAYAKLKNFLTSEKDKAGFVNAESQSTSSLNKNSSTGQIQPRKNEIAKTCLSAHAGRDHSASSDSHPNTTPFSSREFPIVRKKHSEDSELIQDKTITVASNREQAFDEVSELHLRPSETEESVVESVDYGPASGSVASAFARFQNVAPKQHLSGDSSSVSSKSKFMGKWQPGNVPAHIQTKRPVSTVTAQPPTSSPSTVQPGIFRSNSFSGQRPQSCHSSSRSVASVASKFEAQRTVFQPNGGAHVSQIGRITAAGRPGMKGYVASPFVSVSFTGRTASGASQPPVINDRMRSPSGGREHFSHEETETVICGDRVPDEADSPDNMIETPPKISVSNMKARFTKPTAVSKSKRLPVKPMSPKRRNASQACIIPKNEGSTHHDEQEQLLVQAEAQPPSEDYQISERAVIETPQKVSVAHMKSMFGGKKSGEQSPIPRGIANLAKADSRTTPSRLPSASRVDTSTPHGPTLPKRPSSVPKLRPNSQKSDLKLSTPAWIHRQPTEEEEAQELDLHLAKSSSSWVKTTPTEENIESYHQSAPNALSFDYAQSSGRNDVRKIDSRTSHSAISRSAGRNIKTSNISSDAPSPPIKMTASQSEEHFSSRGMSFASPGFSRNSTISKQVEHSTPGNRCRSPPPDSIIREGILSPKSPKDRPSNIPKWKSTLQNDETPTTPRSRKSNIPSFLSQSRSSPRKELREMAVSANIDHLFRGRETDLDFIDNENEKKGALQKANNLAGLEAAASLDNQNFHDIGSRSFGASKPGLRIQTEQNSSKLETPGKSPRSRSERPWNIDKETLSPTSWKNRTLAAFEVDLQQKSSFSNKKSPARQRATGIPTVTTPSRRSQLDARSQMSETSREDCPRQRSRPSQLTQMAADSIHAVDFEQAVASMRNHTSMVEDDDSHQSSLGDSAIPNVLPPELARTLASSKPRSKALQGHIPFESNGGTAGIIFGDPATYGEAGGEARAAPPKVLERAQAIAAWKGGLGVKPPKKSFSPSNNSLQVFELVDSSSSEQIAGTSQQVDERKKNTQTNNQHSIVLPHLPESKQTPSAQKSCKPSPLVPAVIQTDDFAEAEATEPWVNDDDALPDVQTGKASCNTYNLPSGFSPQLAGGHADEFAGWNSPKSEKLKTESSFAYSGDPFDLSAAACFRQTSSRSNTRDRDPFAPSVFDFPTSTNDKQSQIPAAFSAANVFDQHPHQKTNSDDPFATHLPKGFSAQSASQHRKDCSSFDPFWDSGDDPVDFGRSSFFAGNAKINEPFSPAQTDFSLPNFEPNAASDMMRYAAPSRSEAAPPPDFDEHSTYENENFPVEI